MAKSKETYLKVAETFKAKGDKLWAKAKAGNSDSLFKQARDAYATAEKAKESASKA